MLYLLHKILICILKQRFSHSVKPRRDDNMATESFLFALVEHAGRVCIVPQSSFLLLPERLSYPLTTDNTAQGLLQSKASSWVGFLPLVSALSFYTYTELEVGNDSNLKHRIPFDTNTVTITPLLYTVLCNPFCINNAAKWLSCSFCG